MMKKKIKIGYADVDIQLIDKKLFPKWSTEHLGDYDANNQVIRILTKQRPSEEQRTQKDERLKLFEGSGTKDVGTWSPVMELPFPLPASRYSSPVPASRSAFPFVEIFDFIKDKHRL
jgi:hypothetical protein